MAFTRKRRKSGLSVRKRAGRRSAETRTSLKTTKMASLAIKNLFHEKVRLVVTLRGIVFSVILTAVQLGIFQGFIAASTDVVGKSNADLCFEQKRRGGNEQRRESVVRFDERPMRVNHQRQLRRNLQSVSARTATPFRVGKAAIIKRHTKSSLLPFARYTSESSAHDAMDKVGFEKVVE